MTLPVLLSIMLACSPTSGLTSVDDSEGPPTATNPTPDENALLTGMTPSDMTVPEGWKVHATEDFENLDPTNFSRFSTPEIATDRAHTGSRSIANTISGDGQQNGGAFGSVSGSEVYISWWEYIEEKARWNDEFVMARVFTRDPFHEIMLDYMHGREYNATVGNYVTIVQGQRAEAFWGTGGQFKDERPRDRWVQYEWRVKPNTPGVSNGEIDLWRDGVKLLELRDANLNGDHDMTGLKPVVGGTYTRHNWMKQDANGNCVEGEYIGDGASYEGHSCFEPNTDVPVRCKTFSDGCAVGPAPPVFRHWIDDVIVLVR